MSEGGSWVVGRIWVCGGWLVRLVVVLCHSVYQHCEVGIVGVLVVGRVSG